MSFPISSGGSSHGAYPGAMSGGMGAEDILGRVSDIMKGGKRRSRRSRRGRSRRSRQRGGLSDTTAQQIGSSIVAALDQQKGGKRRSRKRTSRKRKYGGKRRSTKRRMSGGLLPL